jgi:hypothetical protein
MRYTMCSTVQGHGVRGFESVDLITAVRASLAMGWRIRREGGGMCAMVERDGVWYVAVCPSNVAPWFLDVEAMAERGEAERVPAEALEVYRVVPADGAPAEARQMIAADPAMDPGFQCFYDRATAEAVAERVYNATCAGLGYGNAIGVVRCGPMGGRVSQWGDADGAMGRGVTVAQRAADAFTRAARGALEMQQQPATQAAVAEAIDVSPQQLSDCLRGHRGSLDTVAEWVRRWNALQGRAMVLHVNGQDAWIGYGAP